MEKILNFINGEFRAPINNNYLDNYNPAKGEVYSLVANSDADDVELAVQAAQNAFPGWSKTTVAERADFLLKIAAKIADNIELLAIAESVDNGKPLSLCRTLDIPRASQNFKAFANSLPYFTGEFFETDLNNVARSALNYTQYSPIGVVAIVSPWNLPLYSFTWKIAPALAAGNTVLAKPSELTPMTAFLLSRILQEVGLPPGVLNILHGTGGQLGMPLVSHPKVKAISFTGSTRTGRTIAQTVAADFKKLSLEMGGKNANIIFADADFDKAIKTTLRSSFMNQGQVCLSGSRIFIEKSIYTKFRDALVTETKKLKIGNPLAPDTDQGALVSRQHMEKVLSYIALAKDEGGTILCGGHRASMTDENAHGYFVEPTLIEGLSTSCRTNQEEIFGPVAVLIPFETEEEVIKMANSTEYGLSASLWTSNISRGHTLAAQLDVGVVWVNTWMVRDLRTPFGGIKESGLGREGGFEGLAFFSEVKNICVGL